MTLMKEKAVRMIQHIPEENMLYVVNILENLQAMSVNRDKDREEVLNSQKIPNI